MGLQNLPSHRAPKGSVIASEYKDRIRIRWRYEGKRFQFYVSPSVSDHVTTASIIATIIEKDLEAGCFDPSLTRYRELPELNLAVLREMVEQPTQSPLPKGTNRGEVLLPKAEEPFNVLNEFRRFLAARSFSMDAPELSSYYTQTIAMVKKWGDFDVQDTPVKLSEETFGNKTFNDRRNCLNSFFEWCVRKGKLRENPLADVSTRKRSRNCDERQPFKAEEARLILDALKTDRFRSKYARYSHSQYYPFVAFMLYTGVRTAEAIGLRVKDIAFPTDDQFMTGGIRIGRALARTSKGTHAAVRKEKGTKNNKVRDLRFNKTLLDLLKPLCENRSPDDWVFVNEQGKTIDDKMFLRRVFKPLQEQLGIPYRHLYALRHTFATNAVEQGMMAHQVAFLMGDLTETVLKNYFHNERRPDYMPAPVTEFSSPVIPLSRAIDKAV